MNVISFSLYGNHPKYNQGMIRNAELAFEFYPKWEVFVYCDPMTTDLRVAEKLQELKCSLFNEPLMAGSIEIPPMMRRYLACDFQHTNRVIFRDADSRLSEREAEAVQAWIESDKIFHIMRDHPAHTLCPGGMIGIQCRRDNWQMPSMRRLIESYFEHCPLPHDAYGTDQDFLANKLWPMFRESTIQHDAIEGRRKELGALPWPSPRKNWPRFVGEVWEINGYGNEFPRPGDWESCPK